MLSSRIYTSDLWGKGAAVKEGLRRFYWSGGRERRLLMNTNSAVLLCFGSWHNEALGFQTKEVIQKKRQRFLSKIRKNWVFLLKYKPTFCNTLENNNFRGFCVTTKLLSFVKDNPIRQLCQEYVSLKTRT